MVRMSFYDWLMMQVDRDDPIGDLANDAKRDHTTSDELNSYKKWRHHLWQYNACREASEALKEAWDEFQSAS